MKIRIIFGLKRRTKLRHYLSFHRTC